MTRLSPSLLDAALDAEADSLFARVPLTAALAETYAREYVRDFDATRALRATLPDARAWPDTALRRLATALLSEPAIASAIERAALARWRSLDINADRVLGEIAHVAFADIGDLFDDSGRLLPLSMMPAGARRAIASLDVAVRTGKDGDDVRVASVKMLDKLKALDMLGRYLRLFADAADRNPDAAQAIDEDAIASRVAALLDLARRRRDAAQSCKDLL